MIPLLDAKAVAERLGCSLRTVRELTSRRELPVVRIGRSARYEAGAVESYIAARTRPALRGPLAEP